MTGLRSRDVAVALSAAFLATGGHVAPGPQEADDLIHDLVVEARRSVESLRNPDAAIAAGYRAVGRETPPGGRIWLHPGLMIHRTRDVSRPVALGFVTIGDSSRLGSVTYAQPEPSEPDRMLSAIPSDMWRPAETCGDTENLNPSALPASRPEACPRMVRVWIGIVNPDGMFTAENWTLPLLRAGLSASGPRVSDAGRAVAMTEDIEWFIERIHDRSRPKARRVLHAGRSSAIRALTDNRTAPEERTLSVLADVWERTCVELKASVGADAVPVCGPGLHDD